MIDLSGAAPVWPAAARRTWRRSLCEAALATSAMSAFDPCGDELLREQIARVQRLEPELVTVVSSVRAAALSYRRRERVIVMERPTFDGVLLAASAGGARVQRADWAAMVHRWQPPYAALWFTSPGRNPDGASLDQAGCDALSEQVRRGRRVVVNGAHSWFAPAAPRVEGADLIGSLHKIAGRGARLAWVYSPDFAREALPELIGTTPPPLWQRAWGLFFAAGGVEELAAAVTGQTRAAVEAFHEGMRAKLGHDVPAADGPNRLLRLAPEVAEAQALARLEELGFRLTAGAPFGAGTPALRANFTGVQPEAAADFARLASDPSLFEVPPA
jgi:DNA-binding transcriptional MocR family regulator